MKKENNILIAFMLNIFFCVFEFLGGLVTGSVAIMSDAIHDFGDSISIGTSYFLEKISKRQPDNNYTYGYLRYSILGAFITSFILLLGVIGVGYASIARLFNPVPINYNGVILFAIVGVVVNFIAAYFTKEGDSLNQRAVNLHMIEDVLNWVVVLIGSILMKITNISIIDSFMSLGIAIFLLIHVIKNLKEILFLFLEKIPTGISVSEVKEAVMEIENIVEVHHIHIWSIDGIHHYATMHVVISKKGSEHIKQQIRERLANYHISHVTIETESEKEKCQEENCYIENKKIRCNHKH